MLQQVMTNPGEIIFREVPVPEAKENQVLVKIMNIGVCGSDIHVYHGKHPFTKYPVTQGHEVSGEITELGKNVTEFHVGQKVTIEPQVYCGHCYPCRHGKYNLCEELKVMGFQTTGTASESVSYTHLDVYKRQEYNRLETLKSYNYEIISRISSHEIREKLMAKGLYLSLIHI